MKKDLEIALAIKEGDINRKKFFINKLKSDLKKCALEIDDKQLEKLFNKAVDRFIEKKPGTRFYFSCLAFVRDNWEKEVSNDYVPNEMFTRSESIIIQRYLDNQDDIASSKKIAQDLGVSILDVSNTIYKLKSMLLSNRKEVLSLFPDARMIIKKKEEADIAVTSEKNGNTNTPSISAHNLELIGHYTGQIDDICLSIDELAKKYYTTCEVIERQLKTIIISCKDSKFYSIILEKYPSIEEILIIKARALGVSFKGGTKTTAQKTLKKVRKVRKETPKKGRKRKKETTEKEEGCPTLYVYDQRNLHFLQTLYQRKPDGTFFSEQEIAKKLELSLETFKRRKDCLYRKLEAKEYSDKLLAYYPNLFIDMRDFDGSIQPNSKMINTYLSFLSTIYQVKGDGDFYPISASLKQLRIQRKTYDKRKAKIYQAFDNNDSIRKAILKAIPDFLEKKKSYEQFLSSDVEAIEKGEAYACSKTAYKYAEFFKALYTKNDDGRYPSTNQLAEQFHITKQSTSARKVAFLENMEKRENLKKEVLELYPSLYEDKKIYDADYESSLEANNDFSSLNVDWAVDFCQYMYKTQIHGRYLSYSMLARQKQTSVTTFTRKRDLILQALEENETFRTDFLEKYPNFPQDKLLYEEAHARGEWLRRQNKKSIPLEEYVNLLRAYYEEKKDGTYATLLSLEDVFHTKGKNLFNRKKKILNLLESNAELKQQALKLYPTLYEDIAIRKAVKGYGKGIKNTISVDLGKRIAEKYVTFLRGIYQETGEHISFGITAEKLGYTQSELLSKIKKISKVVKNEKNVRKYFNLLYPTLEDDMKAYAAAEQLIKDKKFATENAKLYSEFLKAFYHRKSDGSYSVSVNLCSYLKQLNMPNLRSAKFLILQELERNSYLLDEVIRLYPTFLEDKKNYEESISTVEQEETNHSNKQKTRKTKGSVRHTVNHFNNGYQEKLDFLKLYYQKNEKGNYYSIQEIAKILGVTYSSVWSKNDRIEKQLSDDEEFRSYVLERYPTAIDVIANRAKAIKAKKCADFLRIIYQKKEDGTYRSVKEMIEASNMSESGFYVLKNKYLNLLDSDEEIRNLVLVEYPTFMEDMNTFNSLLTENERKVADAFLVDKTREITTYVSLAKNLHINPQFVKILEDKTLIKIGNCPILQRDYPTALVESSIRRNSRKGNTVYVSEEELGEISDTSTDFSTDKSALLKGIQLLENSIYKDFVQLCTPQQKAMLALRLGFFNHTIFGSQDIAEMFNVSVEEVSSLTEECLKLCCNENGKLSQKRKRKKL